MQYLGDEESGKPMEIRLYPSTGFTLQIEDIFGHGSKFWMPTGYGVLNCSGNLAA
jgi:hypothetical protein